MDKHLHPLPAQLHLVGQHRGPSWEFQGVFSSPEAADAACKTRAFFVYPITLDEEQPTETTMHAPGSVRWPRCDGGEPIEAFAQAWASRDVLAERQRQISTKGWTPEHDDEHHNGQLAVGGAAYALAGLPGVPETSVQALCAAAGWHSLNDWDGWLKIADRRTNLVKAAALLLAEIERLDRAAEAAAPPGSPSSSAGGRGTEKAEGQPATVDRLKELITPAGGALREGAGEEGKASGLTAESNEAACGRGVVIHQMTGGSTNYLDDPTGDRRFWVVGGEADSSGLAAEGKDAAATNAAPSTSTDDATRGEPGAAP